MVFGGRALTTTGMGKYIENVSSVSLTLHSSDVVLVSSDFRIRCQYVFLLTLCPLHTDWNHVVLGGTEDILSDLGVRQAMKKMPADARL